MPHVIQSMYMRFTFEMQKISRPSKYLREIKQPEFIYFHI
jgi:hypothetical protein